VVSAKDDRLFGEGSFRNHSRTAPTCRAGVGVLDHVPYQQKMFIIDAQTRDRRRFIVSADEELAALLELERVANAVKEV